MLFLLVAWRTQPGGEQQLERVGRAQVQQLVACTPRDGDAGGNHAGDHVYA